VGELGGGIRAGVPPDRPVDQFADQFSPGNTRCLRSPVQCGGLALGEVDIGPGCAALLALVAGMVSYLHMHTGSSG
jgi:hypothetical protein